MVSYTYDIARFLVYATIGIAIAYLVLGIDDIVFDAIFWIRSIARARLRLPPLTLEQLRSKPEKRIAIFVPCWHEDEVIGRMLDYACRSLEYSRYDILVGVYPNDPPTIAAARAAAAIYDNVHVVVNDTPGPTTKAQNLNSMYAAMPSIEGDDRIEIVVLNDVEDLVHPLSLLVYNYLMPQKEMVQLPVFPLERPASRWTAWTYADEFAENHLKDLVMREAINSFVPSAGVGCAFSRDALEVLAVTSNSLFPANSLTEDYLVALRLRLKGFRTIFVHQKLNIPGIVSERDTAAAYVATRAYFPDTFGTAVRQKTRWVAGICFQAWQSTGWVGNAPTRYALYRDRKGVLSNLLALVGYVILLGAISLFVWHAYDARVGLPLVGNNHWVWALLDFTLTITLIRLLEKVYFVSSLYGTQQGLLCMLRPPWGSLINGLATIRAAAIVTRAAIAGKDLAWTKTTHAFPTEVALGEFRRQLGAVLIANRKLTEAQLGLALAEQKKSRERLGDTLVRLGFVSPRDVVAAVGRQSGSPTAVDDDLVADPEMTTKLPLAMARELAVLPLRVDAGRAVFAVAETLSALNAQTLESMFAMPLEQLLAERPRLRFAIERSYAFDDVRRLPLGAFLVHNGYIDQPTLDRELAAQRATDKPLLEFLLARGLLDSARVYDILQDYFGTTVVPLDATCGPDPELVARLPAGMFDAHEVALVRCAGEPSIVAAFPMRDSVRAEFEAAVGMPLASLLVRHSEVVRLRAATISAGRR